MNSEQALRGLLSVLLLSTLVASCGAPPRPPTVRCERDQVLAEACGSHYCVSLAPECVDAPSCACLIEHGPCSDPESSCDVDAANTVAFTLEEDPTACVESGNGRLVVSLVLIDGC